MLKALASPGRRIFAHHRPAGAWYLGNNRQGCNGHCYVSTALKNLATHVDGNQPGMCDQRTPTSKQWHEQLTSTRPSGHARDSDAGWEILWQYGSIRPTEAPAFFAIRHKSGWMPMWHNAVTAN